MRYLGVWYEQKRYENEGQLNNDCVAATYTLQENGVIGVKNTGVFLANDRRFQEVNGKAVISFPEKDHQARLNVSFGIESWYFNSWRILPFFI
jgi:apolipoprotein D and lipocalin family protein